MKKWFLAGIAWIQAKALPTAVVSNEKNPIGPVLEAYVLVTSAFLIVGINLIFQIQNWGHDTVWRWLPSYILFAVILVLIQVNRRGHFKIAAWMSIIMGSAYNFSLFYVGTLYEPAICTMLLVALAGLILGPWSSFISLVGLSGIWGLHAYFDYRHWLQVELPQRGPLYDIESLFFFGLFLVVLHKVIFSHLETAWKRVAEERSLSEAARQRAEEATLAKSRFLADASHELRTPLSGIIGLLDLAQRKPHLEVVKSDLKLALRNAESLLGILNDLLDNSKLEAGRFTLEKIPFQLRRVLEDHLSPLTTVAEAKGIQLRVEMDEKVPDALVGDPLRLRQILLNLIGNAIKFTQNGHVTLRIQRHYVSESSVQLVFEIEDTGLGMDDDAIRRLFTAYEQADASVARQFGGTGLGLSIVRQLVRLMNGDLRVKSQIQQGSSFRVELPFELAESHELSISNGQPLPPHTHRLRILVAEDGATNQVVVRGYLEGMGHEIHLVEDGHAACLTLSERSFDVVILDGRMPVMSGVEALTTIRAGGLPEHPVLDADIFALALTANGMATDREAFLSAGAQGFLIKPLQEIELHRFLAEAIERQLQRGHHLEPLLDSEFMGGTPSALENLDALLTLETKGQKSIQAGTSGAFQVKRQVEAAPNWSPVPSEATQSLDRKNALREKMGEAWRLEGPTKLAALKTALRDHQWSMVSFWAHTLKGSSVYLQFEEIHRLCAEIESMAEEMTSSFHADKIPVADKIMALEVAMEKSFRSNQVAA